jgi:hypothetical protein
MLIVLVLMPMLVGVKEMGTDGRVDVLGGVTLEGSLGRWVQIGFRFKLA